MLTLKQKLATIGMRHIDMEFYVLFEDESKWQWWDHADANDVQELIEQYQDNSSKKIVKVCYVDDSASHA